MMTRHALIVAVLLLSGFLNVGLFLNVLPNLDDYTSSSQTWSILDILLNDDVQTSLRTGSRELQGRTRRRPRKSTELKTKSTKEKNEAKAAIEIPVIPVEHLKVSTPIFVLSLPKSGTTSLFKFFLCAKVFSAHTFGKNYTTGKSFRLGQCMRKNYLANKPMVDGCGNYKVYTDNGFIAGPGNCFYPSLHAVDRIVSDYPNATIIVSYRPGWLDSIRKYNMLNRRWAQNCAVFPNVTEQPAVWEDFYLQHRLRIRKVIETSAPHVNYLEFDLTDPLAAQRLSNFTGIEAQCWGDCKPNFSCSSSSLS